LSNYPKPSFVISESNFSLVWFGSTNHFLVVQGALRKFFSEAVVQIESEYEEALKTLLDIHPEITDLMQIISEVNSDSFVKETDLSDCKHLSLNNFQVSKYTVAQNIVSVYYASKELQTLFEAPFIYLKGNNTKCNKADNQLALFSSKKLIYATDKDQFFVLQAQFANKLIEFYHSIKKPHWLCAFHGCAVQKNNKTFLLLGDSGAGKSTLSSLLSLSEYRFIADDLVLMDHDFKIYDNPAAVSVKENSWPVIESYYKTFSTIKTSKKVKGQIKMKFLPLHELQNNTPQSFNVDALVWVNYSSDQINRLTPLGKQKALSRLIPDTWTSSELASAKVFADWAMNIKTYHLDYYEFNIVKKLFDAQLF
jgi:hypothetical protein